MKKIIVVCLVLVGIGFGVWRYYQSSHSIPLRTVFVQTQRLTNYTQKSSITISFPQTLKISSRINDSMLQLKDERNGKNFVQSYEFDTQNEDFEGIRSYEEGVLTLKSPMYQKYIQIADPTQYGLVFSNQPMDAFILQSLLSNLSTLDLRANRVTLNGEKIKTATINLPSKSVQLWIKKTLVDGFSNSEIKDYYLEHLLLKNKLLKEDKRESQLFLDASSNLSKYQKNFNRFLSQVSIQSAQVALTVDQQNYVRELDVVLQGQCKTQGGKNISFNLYIDTSVSNIGKTKINSLSLNKTNSVTYSEMNDQLDYSDNAQVENKVSPNNLQEYTSNLKEVGRFRLILPSSQGK